MNEFDLLIIGCGPAAWSCAITARQRSLSVAVAAAESTSSWLYRAEEIANYPGLPAVSGRELLRIFREQAESLGTTVMHGVARQVQQAGDMYMTLIGNDIVMSKAVVIATGAARPRLLPGEDELLGQGVSWCGTCDGMFYRGREVAVISAWHGGVEEADFLARLCSSVDYYTLVSHETPSSPAWRHADGLPKSLSRGDDGRIALTTSSGVRSYDGVFVFRPAVAADQLMPGLALNGVFISTDRAMRTNLPRIYAAGDCTGHPLQIAKAVGEGNVAAISAADDLQKEN